MWDTIIGHKKQIGQLKGVINSKIIPHAYLFSGINGIGKKLVAGVTAYALLCSNPKDATPCGGCKGCRKAIGKNHPDLLEIGPENNQITIDVVRKIKAQMKFPPLEGERRIIIIDQADLMNPNAANAALKILEEPPAGNHFFIITSTPNQLLPTIISRCQKIGFSPLTETEIESYLLKQRGYDSNQAKSAAAFSEGSIEIATGVTPDLIDVTTKDLGQALKAKSASNIMEISEKWASKKDDLANILYIIHRCFHKALTLGTDQPSTKGTPDEMGALINFIYLKNDRMRLIEKCALINRLHSYTTRTYNKQLMFEQLLFSLAA